MHVVIQPSPSVTHKLRVTLPNMRVRFAAEKLEVLGFKNVYYTSLL